MALCERTESWVAEQRRGEDKMAAALRPFGWTCTEDFWRRYYSDPWVFNLANAVERLTEERARLIAQVVSASERP